MKKRVPYLWIGVFIAISIVAGVIVRIIPPSNESSGAALETYFSASGNAMAGDFYTEQPEDFLLARGDISISAIDIAEDQNPPEPTMSDEMGMGAGIRSRDGFFGTADGRDEGSDRLSIDAKVEIGDKDFHITVRRVLKADPLGIHKTWGGVGIDKPLAESGEAIPLLTEDQSARLVGYGVGEIVCHGETLGSVVPVRVLLVRSGLPAGSSLALDLGDPKLYKIMGLPGDMKQMRILWPDYQEEDV